MSTYGVTLYGGGVYGPFLITSLVPSYLGLRVNFIIPLHDDAALRNPDNYTIVPIVPLAVNVDVVSVTPEPGGSPTYVDLECTDLTDGKNYQFTLAGGVIQDAGCTIYVASYSMNYVGVSIFPVIQRMRAISATEMEVTFSKPMSPNADFIDISRYNFDKGLQVLSLTILSSSVISLRTSKQTPSELYTLTVTV